MTTLNQIKTRLHKKLALLKQRKQTAAASGKNTCTHEWQRYKETIMPYRRDKDIVKGFVYSKGRAYFVTMGCKKCHKKRRVSMVVEDH
jgi:hypothetical protein